MPDELNLDEPAPSRTEVVSAKRTAKPLPESPEAERGVIAACLLDSSLVERCAAAGLHRSHFVHPAHVDIYEAITLLHDRHQPVEASTVYSELEGRATLTSAGGLGFLINLTAETPTTAAAISHLDTVLSKAALREAIRLAGRVSEQAYHQNGDASQFLRDFARQAGELAQAATSEAKDAEELTKREFNPDNLIARPEPIYSISGVPVCTPGNLTTIYSQAKTGKSSFLAAMIAAAMTNPTSGHDTLGVTGPNYAKRAVLHFDTEQSHYDWQQLVQLSLRRVGLSRPPPWLRSYTVAGLEAPKIEKLIHAAMRRAAVKFGGVHSVFIDGIADLVNDPNSPDECFPLVARLHGAAIRHETAIINILHLNPQGKTPNDKGRGHLGSQLERKSESNLTLKKDGDVTQVVGEGRQRGRPIPSDKSPAFRWSDEKQMHASCELAKPEATTKRGRPSTHEFSDYRTLFPAHTEPGLELNPLFQRLQTNKPIKKDALFHALKRWAADGMVEIVQTAERPNRYRLAV